MTEPYIGQITQFGFNYPPYQWAFCDGTVIQIQQNTALFALLGTSYGGNGTTNFQLPDFRGRVVAAQGQGPGLSPRGMGQLNGTNTVTLLQSEMPRHTHPFNFFGQNIPTERHTVPVANDVISPPTATTTTAFIGADQVSNTTLSPQLLAVTGGTLPHENRQPYLAVNFSIALYGVFPSFD